MESNELTPLSWLSKEIGNHVVSWTVLHPEVTCFNVIRNEEVMDVHVTGAFTAGGPSIVHKQHSTLVVLVDHTVLDLVSWASRK